MSRSESLHRHDTRHGRGRVSVSPVPNGPSDSLDDYHSSRSSSSNEYHGRSSSSNHTSTDRSSSCYDDGISNPFIANLPQKPGKLSKERELSGGIKLYDTTKLKQMRRNAELLNSAVARGENYIRDFHHTACQTHDIASAALAEGWKFVKSLRKDVLSLKAERDKFKDDSRDYKNESELTKSRLEAITEVKLNKAREVTRLTSDLKTANENLKKLKKELSEAQKKLVEGGGTDANAVSLHVQKKQVDLAAHKAKKQFDNSEKVKKDKKQKASKEARLHQSLSKVP